MALLALFGIAAGTLLWRYWNMNESRKTQHRIASVLERTEKQPIERIAALDSVVQEYGDNSIIQRIGRYHLVQAHVEAKSDSVTLGAAVDQYFAIDTTWLAHMTVASAFNERHTMTASGIRHIDKALGGVRAMPKPEKASVEHWKRQKDEMIGHCELIRGGLLTTSGHPAEGIAALKRAVQKLPDSHAAKLRLAQAWESTGSRDSALTAYYSVVRLRYDHPEAREAIGRIYRGTYRHADVGMVIDTLVSNARERRKTVLLADTLSRKAPEFSLRGLDGAEYSLESTKGKVVVMDIWATWCGPCRLKMPQLQKAYDRFGHRENVVFLAVSVDDDLELIPPFVEKAGYTFPVAHGGTTFGRKFGVEGIPTLFIIDRTGTIRYRELGYSGVGDFETELGWKIDRALEFAAP